MGSKQNHANIPSLPAEVYISIAKYCETHDPINLCLTSRRERETFASSIHVDQWINRNGSSTPMSLNDGQLDKQQHRPKPSRIRQVCSESLRLRLLVGCRNGVCGRLHMSKLWMCPLNTSLAFPWFKQMTQRNIQRIGFSP